ncbi:hypothetical protein AB6A23_12580 [Paenibacillus tarimensis]
MKRKSLVFVVITIGVIVLLVLCIYVFKLIDNHFSGESKHNRIIEIVSDYLNNSNFKETQSIRINAYNKAFSTFEVTVNSVDNSSFNVLVRDDLKSLRDSRTEELYNRKLSEYLKSKFKSEFQEIKSEVRVNIMTDNQFSTRKDYLWITLIDPNDITKQEFQNVALNILEWISKEDYKLDKLYLDFMNTESSGRMT